MKFFYRIVNALLLVAMCATIAVFSIWKLSPKKLNSLGQNWVQGYIDEGDASASKALDDLSQGDPAYAEKLLNIWSDIGNDDRYYKHKRAIMIALSKHLIENERFEDSVVFLRPFLRENDRDIILFIEWAKSALKLPELEESAGVELSLMSKRFPDNAALNTLYINDVLHKGDKAAALQALSEIRGVAPKLGGWSVLWKLEDKPKYEKRVWIKLASDDKQWSLDISAPQTASEFRVDPPPHVRMDISDIEVASGTKSEQYALPDVVEIHMMQAVDNVLSAQGLENPYFVIKTPDWLSTTSSDDAESIKIIFKISNVGLNAVADK